MKKYNPKFWGGTHRPYPFSISVTSPRNKYEILARRLLQRPDYWSGGLKASESK